MVRDFTDLPPEICANTRVGFVNRIFTCQDQLGLNLRIFVKYKMGNTKGVITFYSNTLETTEGLWKEHSNPRITDILENDVEVDENHVAFISSGTFLNIDMSWLVS